LASKRLGSQLSRGRKGRDRDEGTWTEQRLRARVGALNVLDAKTHNFTGAWKAGFTGCGVTVPAAWTKSGHVFLGSHPDDYLVKLFGERVAFLVTDPNTAGVYDTVYVDLSDDYDFSDE
jgi:hypothetical protein